MVVTGNTNYNNLIIKLALYGLILFLVTGRATELNALDG
jgi:hypothetical protein